MISLEQRQAIADQIEHSCKAIRNAEGLLRVTERARRDLDKEIDELEETIAGHEGDLVELRAEAARAGLL